MIVWLAASAWALDLEEARAIATSRAIMVERADAEADAAAAAAGAAVWGALPSVTATADLGRFGGFTAIGIERPATTQVSAGANARLVLIDPSVWLGAASARTSARGAEAMAAWARVDARAEVTRLYAAAVVAAEVTRVLEGSAVDAERGASAVLARVDAGLLPAADGSRARAEAALLRADVARAEADEVAACASLQALLRVEIVCDSELVGLGGAFAGAATGRHPALEAAEEAQRAADASRAAALWSLAPSVSASADVAEYVASGGSGPGWSVGVGASMPILGPGLADARGARAAADAARLGVEEQERGLRVALVSAEADLAAAERVIEALDVAVSASADAWSRVDALFEAGLVDVNAWIDARRARDEAAVARARATEERWAAVAATEAARGVR